jgi:phospholipase/carboxylesterase
MSVRKPRTAGGKGRLRARPSAAAGVARAGLRPLGLAEGRDGLLYVPPGVTGRPAPLVLALHGSGADAEQGVRLLRPLAEEAGFLVLAPDSRGDTWDVILGGLGPDVAFIDRALDAVFARHPVDAARVAAAGFSDGASYALSLGLTNGDLFTHVLAFSPGFLATAARAGTPRVFVSHGTLDRVLPVACSRRIVPRLRQAGHDVLYREFDGGHDVPPDTAREAVAWFLAPP